MLRLAIIIINYRTPKFIGDCLNSLETQLDRQRDRVVIVDNASGEGSEKLIEEMIALKDWQHWVQLERSPVNGGFSAGNNYGISRADASFYLLLNSDTIVRSGAIARLLAAAENEPKAGLISPRLEWPDEEPQQSCFRLRTPVYEFFVAARTGLVDRMFGHKGGTFTVSDVPMQPDWTSFACVLIRKTVFESIGLLDDNYFMYFEDMDFCRRARQAGYGILHWPTARVVHLRGGSSPVKQLAAERKRPPRYWYASRNRYYAKFHGIPGLWLANGSWYAGRIISLLREILGLKQPHIANKQWFDIWTNGLYPLKTPSFSKRANVSG